MNLNEKKCDESRKKLVLYGAGGLARETAVLVRQLNAVKDTFELIGFVVDEEYYHPSDEANGIPVLGTREWLIEHRDEVVCNISVGYPKDRRRLQKELSEEGVGFVNLIHPEAWIEETTVLGIGCLIQRGVRISCNCRIGDGVLLNGDIGIGHDAVLEDYVVCFPGSKISGRCRIGEAASLGSQCFINERLTVGKEAVVAPGSIVFTKVKPNTHVLGNPARRIEI